MPILHWATQHRWWALGFGFTLLVALVAAGVWLFALRSPGTRIDLNQALRLYRQHQEAGQTRGRENLPPSGVYRYRTSGQEALSLGGIGRTFPSTTEMIVTDAGCATAEWEPFIQHTEGVTECPQAGGALSMTAGTSHEEIAGAATTEIINCPSTAYLVPPSSAGVRWHATCHAPGQTVSLTGRVVGAASVTVGGRSVPALHTRLTLSFVGSETGTNPTDYWVSVDNGLILREQETVDITEQAGPLGSVHYSEQMSIALASLTPDR
jgi:hypothetical protein